MNKITDWQKQIEQITDDVQDIFSSKYQAHELEKIITANVFVMQHIGSFWEYYKLNYTHFVISKIWHQIDEDPRSLSLLNLLKDLSANHKTITKSWWVSQAPEALSSETFEEKFGEGDELDLSWMSDDIQKLKAATKPITEIRHKRVAHKDVDENFSYSIKGNIINEALSVIEELVIKYQLLLTQSGYEFLTPVSDDWTEAFTVPWIEKTEQYIV